MPVVRLNARFLDAIRPGEKIEEYWDADCAGLALRVMPGGVKGWWIKYRVGGGRSGRQRRYRIGRYPALTLAQARIEARQLFVIIDQGGDPAAARDEKRSGDDVQAFAGWWIDDLRKKGRVKADAWQAVLERDVLPVIGAMKPAEVKRAHIRAIIDRLKSRGVTTGANRVFEIVRALFRWIGREYDDVITADPTFGMRKPFDEKPRERLVTDTELRAIWEALGMARPVNGKSRGGKAFAASKSLVSEPVQIALKLLILTGQRSSEVSQARVDEFDLAETLWRIPAERTKAGRGHNVPLAPAAQELVSRAMELGGGSQWLFPAQFRTRASGNDGPISNTAANHALKRVLAAVGVQGVVVHDFRRLVASGVAALGFGDDVIGALLNHAPKGVTARHYNRHRYEVEKRRALEAWSGRVAEIVDKAPAAQNVIRMDGVRA